MPSLSELTAHPGLGLRLIQAGVGDPDVTWVSTTELTDLSSYLDGGEIVLTTGVSFGEHDERWRDFVADLSRARVAAVGFGVGMTHKHIPQPLIAAASAYRVALIEVPPPTPFIAISKAVASLQSADELRAARDALRAQQRILDLAFDETGPAGIIAAVSAATGRHAAVVDSDDTLVAHTAGFPEHVDSNTSTRLEIEPGRHIVITGPPMNAGGRAALTAGAIVLGVESRSHTREATREDRRWSRIAQLMFEGSAVATDMISLLDPALVLPDLVRAIAVQGSAEAIVKWRNERRTGLSRLIWAPQHGDDTAVNPVAARELSAGVGVAWQICSDEEAGAQVEYATRHGLDVVVGRPVSLEACSLSRLSAELKLPALSASAQLYQEPRVPAVFWVDRGSPFVEMLQAENVRARMQLAVREVLGHLSTEAADTGAREALSAGERGELRRTLSAFLRHHGQRGPCAAELGIHRNTLRLRVQKIEELLALSLHEPESRAEVWFALRLDSVPA